MRKPDKRTAKGVRQSLPSRSLVSSPEPGKTAVPLGHGVTLYVDSSLVQLDAEGNLQFDLETRRLTLSEPRNEGSKSTDLPGSAHGLSSAAKGFSPKGRKLRKAHERPRPDLPADAPVNRTKKQIAFALHPDMLDEVNQTAAERGIDRNTLIETAIRAFLDVK